MDENIELVRNLTALNTSVIIMETLLTRPLRCSSFKSKSYFDSSRI